MTGFKYSFSLAAVLLLNCSNALADLSCTASPDCASLGYSQTAAECNGKATVKCPFDTSKMYCKKTPIIEGCTIGSFIYSDKSCSDTYDKTRTLVGVVFDPVKKLAVISGYLLPAAFETLVYNSDLEFCSPAAALNNCNTDGKVNTRLIFRKKRTAHPDWNPIFGSRIIHLNTVVISSISGTTPISSSLWYGNNHWFYPSLKELDQIYNNLTAINNSFFKISPAYPISKQTYPSSTFNDNLNLFVFDFKTGAPKIVQATSFGSSNDILPIINYGDSSPVLNCTSEGTTDITTGAIDSEGCFLGYSKCTRIATVNNISELGSLCRSSGNYDGYTICSQTATNTFVFGCCSLASVGCMK